MKHKIIIHVVNGEIKSIQASGETDVYLVKQSAGVDAVFKVDADEFRIGTAFEGFTGNARKFLMERKV